MKGYISVEGRVNSSFFVHKSILIFLLVLLHLAPFQVWAQQKSSTDTALNHFDQIKADGLLALGGIKNAFTQPTRWEKENYLIAGSVVLGTAALYAFDEESSRFFTRQKTDVPGVLLEIGHYSSPENLYAFNGLVYLTGLFSKNEKIRDTGVLLLASSTASGIILAIGKTVLGRARPYTGEGKGHFEAFTTEEAFNSFPSGHSLLSFTTAYAIGKQFDNPFIKGGIYGLGLIGPASRLFEGAHWLTDVTVSIALSIAIVEGMENYLNQKKYDSEKHTNKISWDFHVGLGQLGITGRF